MRVIDTRTGKFASASAAILNGIAPSGGLYVPERFPHIGLESINALADKSYSERAYEILRQILPEFPQDTLKYTVSSAYSGGRFSGENAAPLARMDDNTYILELYRGPTLAFKDFALQLLPGLMRISAAIEHSPAKRLILTATSGDTGKAALESFADQSDTACVVFYPENGVSEAQRLQMVTQRGGNTYVIAVRGNFDDAQTGVKKLFGDIEFNRHMQSLGWSLSSANSINFGRLIPQVAYYFSAYADMIKARRIKCGDHVHFVVPTGNFGNILACDYARRMGLPVGKMVCASNANNVLTDFITTGVYDARRALRVTSSPSMDILISSNLERFIYEMVDRDAERVADMMHGLRSTGSFAVDPLELVAIKARVIAGWADETLTRETISGIWRSFGKLIDTHTAVGMSVLNDLRNQCKLTDAPAVLVSTASPFKFGRDVAQSVLGTDMSSLDDFRCCDALAGETGEKVPESISELPRKPILHKAACEPEQMCETVLKLLQ